MARVEMQAATRHGRDRGNPQCEYDSSSLAQTHVPLLRGPRASPAQGCPAFTAYKCALTRRSGQRDHTSDRASLQPPCSRVRPT